MKNGGFGRGERGALFYWEVFQFGRREKTGATVEERGVPSFIGRCSSLAGVKKRGFDSGGRGVFFC